MKRIRLLIFFQCLICLLVTNTGAAPEHPELKAFPEAKEGQERVVIVLPEKTRDEEGAFKVELIPGKVVETDGVNKARLSYGLESRPLKGWGYTFYEVTGRGEMMSTRMGVPPGAKKVEAFVAGQPLLINYNSRLPIVIYGPKGIEIRYRIWRAGETVVAE